MNQNELLKEMVIEMQGIKDHLHSISLTLVKIKEKICENENKQYVI